MKRSLPVLLTLILAVISTIPSFGQTPRMTETDRGVFTQSAGEQTEQEYQLGDEDLESGEDDEPIQRVARITFVDGDVGFLRAGVSEWADAAVNLPLLAGDQVYAGPGARVEIQLGRGNFIRLSENTSLTFTDLSHTAAQFEVTEGIALIRLERYGSAFERFEVDTPNAALLLQRDGFYRINVRGEDESEVIVRNGLAEVTTNDGVFSLRQGQRLMVETSENGRLEIVADSSRDEWDDWSHQRDTTVDRISVSVAPSYVSQQEIDNHCFYGASELSDYGIWTNYGSYGHCWVPRVASGWAPYRSGQWIYMPRGGWSWWSNEPWGWAPYHYGRWVYLNGLGWAWAPGIGSSNYHYGHSYYQWRPALVHFFNYQTPQGNYVGWYPLRPGERWRRPDRYRRDPSRLNYPGIDSGNNRPGNNRRNNSNRWDRRVARDGVTVLPSEGFSRPERSNSRPGAPDADTDRWLKKGVRAGLPDITPTTSVTAPVARDREGRPRIRRVLAPSNEILNRPVITRNRLVDPQITGSAPRERRLVEPKKEKNSKERNSSDVWKPRVRGHDHDSDRAGDRNENQNSDDRRDRRRVAAGNDGQDHSNNQDSSSDRDRRRKDKDDSSGRPAQNNGGNSNDSNNSNQDKQSSRERVLHFPRPRSGDDSNNKPRDNGEKPRQKSNDNYQGPSAPSKPHQDDAPRRSDKSNSGGSSTPRNYVQPPRERPSPSNDNRDRGGSRQENAPRRKG